MNKILNLQQLVLKIEKSLKNEGFTTKVDFFGDVAEIAIKKGNAWLMVIIEKNKIDGSLKVSCQTHELETIAQKKFQYLKGMAGKIAQFIVRAFETITEEQYKKERITEEEIRLFLAYLPTAKKKSSRKINICLIDHNSGNRFKVLYLGNNKTANWDNIRSRKSLAGAYWDTPSSLYALVDNYMILKLKNKYYIVVNDGLHHINI